MPNDPIGLVRHADQPDLSWGEGAGSTRVVAQRLLGGVGPDVVWRVSLATIDRDGEFSHLPGVDRVITALDGPSVCLTIDGAEHTVRPLEPLRFSGDAATSARVPDGPTRVLNVMTRRSRMSASVRVLDLGRLSAFGLASTTVLIQLSGESRVHTTRGESATLGELDALVPRSATRIVEGAGTIAVVRMENFRAWHAFA